MRHPSAWVRAVLGTRRIAYVNVVHHHAAALDKELQQPVLDSSRLTYGQTDAGRSRVPQQVHLALALTPRGKARH